MSKKNIENHSPGQKTTFIQNCRIITRAFNIFHEELPGFISMTSITSVATALRPLITLFFSARILNELSGGRDVQLIILYVAVTVFSVFALSVANILINQRLTVYNSYNYQKLEFLYVKRYMEMDYPNIEDSKVNQMLADIRARSNGNWLGLLQLLRITPTFISNTVTLGISLVMLSGMFTAAGEYTRNWITSPAASLILGVLAALSVVTPLLVRKWQKEAMETIERENPKANTLFFYYHEYIRYEKAAKDVRLYNQGGTLLDIFDKRLGHRMWIWLFRRLATTNGVPGAVNTFTGGSVYLLIGLRALYGMYPIGSIVQYVGAVTNIINNMSGIAGDIGTLLNNIVYMRYIYDFLDLKCPPSGGMKKPEIENINIEFENLSFKYPDSEIYALRNVNLSFKPGQRLAVVGMNGSGKTTMVKLLCRLYQPTQGVIKLNGKDIQSYDHAEYASLFNVVFQDFKLYSLSLGAGVACTEAYDSDKAEKALITAGFGAKLQSLQKGLDTMLGKDCDKEGISLSGGEEQKVAIARAIYRDSPFVVFDEPTAALDPVSEYEVYTRLNEIVGGKTAVFISHRLSSCRFCEKIAVFHSGELIQLGSHQELLLDRDGKYYELWNAQARHYSENAE